jgi:D-arabinose 1-dehydrogenase-like Zn-dependent alcohol dehydrogenase
MAKMKAVQVQKAKGPLELVELDIPEPGPDQVRIKVKACGICHSDSITKEGLFPNIKYPRVPGHEVAGVVDAVGPNVQEWKKGQRVGIGWYGGHCGYCDSCRRGDFITCQIAPQISGVTYDGGYAEYMIAPKEALAQIPDEISFVDAGPLMCAGITTFNSLRNAGAKPGDLVAILGIGGLGHLAVQFAAKMGFKTVAIARGKDKEEFAKELGAHIYIDSQEKNSSEELMKLGGAKIILATVTDSKTMSAAVNGLGVNGKLVVIGASLEPLEISGLTLIMGKRSIIGWASGSSIDSQDTMEFCALSHIRSMNEIYPLEQAKEAYERMMSGQARFRVVLTMGDQS